MFFGTIFSSAARRPMILLPKPPRNATKKSDKL
jgi:hypothetical protein